MDISALPTVNATLNLIAATFLVLGRQAVKRGEVDRHRKFMGAALLTSAIFLISYLTYHYFVGHTKYVGSAVMYGIYLIVLIPHVILATVQVPFILAAVWFALKGRFVTHVRIVQWVWPVWLYVSVTGVLVYLMLYHLPKGTP